MINGKKVLAITLARGGSKSIPRKNIIDINGKPLLQYTTDEVAKSAYIDDYYLSTEDSEIMSVGRNLGVPIIERPTELASDTATSYDAIMHAIDHLDAWGVYDYIVEVMVTNPLKTVDDIDACISKLYSSGADSVTSVVRIYDHHPSRVKYIQHDRMMSFYPEQPESRRQDLLPPAYVRNGSIYAITLLAFNKYKSRVGADAVPYIMPQERTVNIDEPADLKLAELLITGSMAFRK